MKPFIFALFVSSIFFAQTSYAQTTSNHINFNKGNDLLLVQYDCKTDVDDLHTVAAFAMLMKDTTYSNVNYHAVAGTYGIQEGLYVPPNDLFHLAFGKNWSDAHQNTSKAVEQVTEIAIETLKKGGSIWVAEAGQSDFSAMLIKSLKQSAADYFRKENFHIVQHSDWNESVTSPENLRYAKENATYHKIPDGNATGNGTPGFRTPSFTSCLQYLENPKIKSVWTKALELGNKYNGKEGRYLNEAVEAGGVDFSDLCEVCWIMGIEDIKDTQEFFDKFAQ